MNWMSREPREITIERGYTSASLHADTKPMTKGLSSADSAARSIHRTRRRLALGGGLLLLVAGLIPARVSANGGLVVAVGTLIALTAAVPVVRLIHSYGALRRPKLADLDSLSDDELCWEALTALDGAIPAASLGRDFLTVNLLETKVPEERERLKTFIVRARDLRATGGQVRRLLRAGGPALVAVAFIGCWAAVFMAIWAADQHAFGGLGKHAQVGEFVYLAINAAVANVPADLPANSQVAHMAVATEFVLGALLLANFASLLITDARSIAALRADDRAA